MNNDDQSFENLSVTPADQTLEMPKVEESEQTEPPVAEAAEATPADVQEAATGDEKDDDEKGKKGKKNKPKKMKRSAKGWFLTIFAALIALSFAAATVGFSIYNEASRINEFMPFEEAADALQHAEADDAQVERVKQQVKDLPTLAKEGFSGIVDDIPGAFSAFVDLGETYFKFKTRSSDMFVEMGTFDGEPITWIVLTDQGDKKLLLSEKALTAMPFSKGSSCAWANSPIRTWLNGAFIKEAFSDEERERILTTELENKAAGSHDPSEIERDLMRQASSADTKDKVFLLSLGAIQEYMTLSDMILCEPTQHARDEGAYMWPGDVGGCYWWTRTAAIGKRVYAMYSARTEVSDPNPDFMPCVRPAMWVAV